MSAIDLRLLVRDVPDFPKPGIIFKDITPLLNHPLAFRESIARMADMFRGKHIDSIVDSYDITFLFN